jgi:hypothetical protein
MQTLTQHPRWLAALTLAAINRASAALHRAERRGKVALDLWHGYVRGGARR